MGTTESHGITRKGRAADSSGHVSSGATRAKRPGRGRQAFPCPSVSLRGAVVLRLLGLAFVWSVSFFAFGMTSLGAPLPRLFPDYVEVTLPPNIAPLNFRIEEPGSRYRVELRSTHGAPLVVSGRSASIHFPLPAWRALLQANPGQPLRLDIAVRGAGSDWTRFQTVTNHIASEEIDPYLTYRLLKPLYNVYKHLGIYQRHLETFDQRPVLENQRFNGGCLNCHTPLNRSPHTFALDIRGQAKEQPVLLVTSNQVARLDKTLGYLAWHPSGRLLAFSANKLSLFFHTQGETRDVFDARSDLGIYRLDSNTVAFPPCISLTNRNETWPAWSPDGRYLYYSSAPPLSVDHFRRICYDLMRVSYDLATDQWGQPETIVSSQGSALSACQPKVSPDGRFLLFTMCSYGNFPIYQAGSDLHVMDLGTRQSRRLTINSEEADAWHSWSSNSRWVVFSSKRMDGLFARPHFAYVDERGEFHKPFVLPQRDPAFYDSCLHTFNVPELVAGPITVRECDLADAIVKPKQIVVPRSATPTSPEPPGQAAQEDSLYQPARE